ncbi:hypothetical protein NNE60_30410, partial [Escherichia coli]|nr:hypothetical protein [Escherichia coli]MDG5610887.1 hypothetical protein [Escherichia coli]
AGIIFYALATPVLTLRSTQPEKNIPLLFAFGGVIIFTLLSLCVTGSFKPSGLFPPALQK